jgi:glucans biosynthesis protein
MKYNVRPSVWVTPHGNWGKGAVTLFQLPTNNTNTDNVILFWQPDRAPRAGDHLVVDYRIDFFMNDAARPPVAYTRDTFINDPAPPPPAPPQVLPPPPANLASLVPAPAAGKTAKTSVSSPPAAPASPAPAPAKKAPFDTTPVQFLVDFMGNGLENIPTNSAPDLEISANPPGTVVREKSVEKNDFDKSWRVTFTIVPWQHFIPTELKCRLMPHASTGRLQDELGQLQNQIERAELANDESTVKNLRTNVRPQKLKALEEADRHPLSETWTYTWYQ